MDFVGGLPLSRKGHDYLYVFLDKFSKMCILTPCKNKITNEQIGHLFFQNIWVHFGLPTSIVSDRDSRFVGNFWSNLWDMMDTKLKKSIVEPLICHYYYHFLTSISSISTILYHVIYYNLLYN